MPFTGKLKKVAIIAAAASALAISACIIFNQNAQAKSNELVILHTNDTHSLIDPDGGKGGVLQRKAIIDSVRKAEKNVLLVDAGDIVQGTLYFKFFKGDVEFPLMNMMGYDVQILGNHEFDNGLNDLAKNYKTLKADLLSANYDFSGTVMEGILKPYTIKKIGDKKIGFIGINIDPTSLISNANYKGLKFSDPILKANEIASMLKKDKDVDLVVAITHIGARKENNKPTDYELAAASRDIDIIIGGHSHTVIQPKNADNKFPSIVKNADGKPVMMAQTGKYGKNLGYIKINLDNLKNSTPADFDQRLIEVTDRFPDSALDKKMNSFIEPFREKINIVNKHIIGRADADMDPDARVGAYVNWSADFAKWYGDLKADSLKAAGVDIPRRPDMAMMNVGGIRQPMKKGDVTEGQMLATFPFSNHMVITCIKGADFADAMKIAASKGGEAVSNEVRVLTDGQGNVKEILINNQPIDSQRDYYLSTIDYLAWGNDDFTPLAKGNIIWADEPEMSAPILRYLKMLSDSGLPVIGDPRPRFIPVVILE